MFLIVLNYFPLLLIQSLYKSVLLSENTTSLELIQLILHCYNCSEKVTEFQLYEVTKTKSTAMNDSDLPLKRQMQWSDKDNTFFQLRRSKDMITTIVRSSRQVRK